MNDGSWKAERGVTQNFLIYNPSTVNELIILDLLKDGPVKKGELPNLTPCKDTMGLNSLLSVEVVQEDKDNYFINPKLEEYVKGMVEQAKDLNDKYLRLEQH